MDSKISEEERWLILLNQTKNKLRKLSERQLTEVNFYIDDIKNNALRELPEKIEENEKEAFLNQQINEKTKRFYRTALERWEKYFVNQKMKNKGMGRYWEIDEKKLNRFIYSHLTRQPDSSYPLTAISTIKRDLSVYFSFYEYLCTKYYLEPLPAHFKQAFYGKLKNAQKNRQLGILKYRVPTVAEIERICQKASNDITLFALKLASRHGLLPKDFEWIRIEKYYLVFENGRREQIPKNSGELLKSWQRIFENLGYDIYGSKHPAILRWNTQIIDQIRKLTKVMKDNGELKYAYTLSDIKRYFTCDVAGIEEVIHIN